MGLGNLCDGVGVGTTQTGSGDSGTPARPHQAFCDAWLVWFAVEGGKGFRELSVWKFPRSIRVMLMHLVCCIDRPMTVAVCSSTPESLDGSMTCFTGRYNAELRLPVFSPSFTSDARLLCFSEYVSEHAQPQVLRGPDGDVLADLGTYPGE